MLEDDNQELVAATIDAAADVVDPLAELVNRTSADRGAPFDPAALDALAKLKAEDRAAFERLRSQLKATGCRVTQLDSAIAAYSGEERERVSHADTLVALAESAALFHTADGNAFADVRVKDHRETWPIRAKGFRRWLVQAFYENTGGAPSPVALQSALDLIEARANFEGPQQAVFMRVGRLDGRIYLDLADDQWRAVEIDEHGWRLVAEPPVRFRRAPGMKALPTPVSGGSIDALRRFLNVKSDADFVLVVCWALAVIRGVGPYPLLALSGEQGSAKSTFSAILKALLDPNTSPLRSLPREVRDLFITANNGHVLVFDNVSGLPAWLSDVLCRLATGGSFAIRQNYTDQDEILFDATRPMVLNGIEDIVARPDLADRCIIQTLQPIASSKRVLEAALWAAFEQEHPRILGVLLDGVVVGLRRSPHVVLEHAPRMADFAQWATACETAYWPEGTFERAYAGNRGEAVDTVIDDNPVAATVRAFMEGQREWRGTARQLLRELSLIAGELTVGSIEWPKSERALSGKLRRAATFLREIGVEVTFDRDTTWTRSRIIHMKFVAPGKVVSQPSRPSNAEVWVREGLDDVDGTDGSARPGMGPGRDGGG